MYPSSERRRPKKQTQALSSICYQVYWFYATSFFSLSHHIIWRAFHFTCSGKCNALLAHHLLGVFTLVMLRKRNQTRYLHGSGVGRNLLRLAEIGSRLKQGTSQLRPNLNTRSTAGKTIVPAILKLNTHT